MKESYECEVASHIGAESCGAAREGGVRRSMKRRALGFFGRQFEVDQVSAESLSLDGAEGNSYHHPDTTDEPSFPAEVFPEEEANRETGQRWCDQRQDC